MKRSKKNGYVVDHMNNRHEDCRITNLEFLKKNRNTAKGQEFDIDSNDEKLVRQIALNIFKDFSTGHYQITIGCNVPSVWIDDSGKKFQIESIKLLYTGDYNTYPSIIHDAEGIILAYQTGDRIDPMKTHAACVRIYKALIIRAPQTMPEQPTKHYKEGEKGVRGFMYITSVPYDKGWTVPDNFNGEQQYEIIDQYKNMQVNVNSKNW